MNKYDELIYALIYNCKREVSKEEMQILNQASVIYNTYNMLTEQLGCPLYVLVKLVNGDPFYYEDEDGMHFITSYNIETNTINFDDDWNDYDMELGEFGGVEVPFNQYKKTWWLKEDKSE